MNTVRLAAAGAGKTYGICCEALEEIRKDKCARVLMVTYTNRGAEAIRTELEAQNYGVSPVGIVVYTWYQFLLKELIKPYQTYITDINRLVSLDFTLEHSRNYASAGTAKRYITDSDNVRSEEASNLILLLDKRSDHRVFSRLERAYSSIYIDEVQDLAGRDIDILQKLFESSLSVVCVGDNKQATFQTHNTRTNKKKSGKNIFNFFWELQRKGIVQIQESLNSRRFNHQICSFANTVYPNDNNMTSDMIEETEHDGVFLIAKEDAMKYYEFFLPQELRYDKRTINTCGYNVVNFGECKGKTFPRCLIYANKTFISFLKGKELKAPEKYYVAVTRAKYSNAIVVDSLFGAAGFEKCRIILGDQEIEAEKFIEPASND